MSQQKPNNQQANQQTNRQATTAEIVAPVTYPQQPLMTVKSLDEQMPTLLDKLLGEVSINDAHMVTLRELTPVGNEKVYDVSPSPSLRIRVNGNIVLFAKAAPLTEKTKELRPVRVTATTLQNVKEIKFAGYELALDEHGNGIARKVK